MVIHTSSSTARFCSLYWVAWEARMVKSLWLPSSLEKENSDDCCSTVIGTDLGALRRARPSRKALSPYTATTASAIKPAAAADQRAYRAASRLRKAPSSLPS